MTMAAIEENKFVETKDMNPSWTVIRKIESETIDT